MDRATLVTRAKLAEQVERYDDMSSNMSEIAKDSSTKLSNEERNLLSVAFKNVVGSKRSAWRVMTSIGQKQSDEDEKQKVISEKYRKNIEDELNQTCDTVIDLLDNYLLKQIESSEEKADIESQIFYLKMKGDYLRYKVEVVMDDDQAFLELAEKSQNAYEKAQKIALAVPATDPIRLGLALNYSVFYYEIKKDSGAAIALAEEAFRSALKYIDGNENTEAVYKDSTLILQLLRDNLALWNQTEPGEQSNEEEGPDGDEEIQQPSQN